MSAFNPSNPAPQVEDNELTTLKKTLLALQSMPTTSVGSISQLKALTGLTDGQDILVGYGSTPGDGFGGVYRYSGTPYVSPDNITQFNQDVGGGSFTALASAKLVAQFRAARTRLVATGTMHWGQRPSYTTITCGTGRNTVVFPRRTRTFRLVYTGCVSLASFAVPSETDNGDGGEIKVSISPTTGTTEEGRIPVFFGGKRIARLPKAGFLVSDPIELTMPAGKTARIYTFANRLQSTGYTAAGEPGLLASTVANFPRGLLEGTDGTNWNTTDGMHFSTSSGIDPFTLDFTDSGSWVSAGTQTCGPVAIIGDCDADGAQGVALIGDSILAGTGDTLATVLQAGVAWTLNGWGMRAIGSSNAVFRASLGGDGVQYKVDAYTYNFSKRMAYAGLAEVAVVALGTNDLAAGRSVAQVKADLQSLWAMLKERGARRIIAVTIGPRATSTDGYQTLANQTAAGGASFAADALALNTWLRTVPSGCDAVYDAAAAIANASDAAFWKTSTVLASPVIDTGSTSTVIQYAAATFTANQYQGAQLLIGNEMRAILSNTTSAITVASAFGGSPVATTPSKVLNSYAADSVHPGPYGHKALADDFVTWAAAQGVLL